ncbi:PAS domain S-box protein [Candidatus Poribacteria bacterium]|nr:PAS domain S-box protein [Candidatus Poribacteria bacterium]
MLAEGQSSVFDAISPATAGAPRLRVLQEAVFSCLLSFLDGKDSQALETKIAAAAKDAFQFHTLSEQITALDDLDVATLSFRQCRGDGESLNRNLLQIVGFFCKARRAVAEVYPHYPVKNDISEVTRGEGEHYVAPDLLQPIRAFDEVMLRMLDPSIGPDEVLRMICESVLRMSTADAVAIYRVDHETKDFEVKQFVAGDIFKSVKQEKLPEFLSKFALIPRGSMGATGLFDLALSEKRPVFSPDVGNDPRVHMGRELARLGIRAMLIIPMLESGRELGFMSVVLASERAFDPTEIESFSLFADEAALAWRNAELYGAIRKSEQQYRNLIDNATDVIFILDTEGRFVSFNKRAEEVTGYAAEDWIGRSFRELIGQDDLPEALERWSQAVKCSAVTSITIRSAKGENIHFEINSSRIEEDGEWKGMMCIARDVTAEIDHEKEFKKLHDSVVETNRKLEESMAQLKTAQTKLIQTEKLSAMGELISGIAHELNNPLTGIMGYSQFLLESLSDPKAQESIQKINREAIRCKRIVQNLLGFARQQKPQKRVVDLNAIVQSVVDLREYHVRSDGILLDVKLSAGQPQVVGDFHQLQQVLLNILNNAHQAIKDTRKGAKIEVETGIDEREKCAQIRIADDGPGISPEDLPRIFDPFFTTREVGQGTGLGLSAAYGIVQEHNGHITVDSTPGNGASFQIRLPLPETRAEIHITPPDSPPVQQSRSEMPRVLVVDDEEVIIDLLTDILDQMNMSVERACNGEEAFHKVMTGNFDFIICDLKMPGMDGRTLYYKIQEVKPELSKRMILCTGDTLDKDFNAFRTSTNCKFLEKPFLIEDLKAAIRDFSPQKSRG